MVELHKKMDEKDLALSLKENFVATFMEELIPGILHNFANPLNGIMGRIKLLSRRYEEACKTLVSTQPELFPALGLEKINRDITSIANEAERFYTLFKDLSNKFASLNAQGEELVNLSHLIVQEVRFCDFYLDFKHEIKKELFLDEGLPEIKCKPAYYSLSFFALLMGIGRRLKNHPQKVISITTSHDDVQVIVRFGDNAEALPEEVEKIIRGEEIDESTFSKYDHRPLFLSLCLLREMGVTTEIKRADGRNEIAFFIPYRVS